MKNDLSIENIASSKADLYPHLKIPNETFPRMLATRRIEDDEAEYFGAFLPKTAVRILMDFVNRVFRLRTCDIAIDGSFPVPCTEYYRKRCLAPCVAHICPQDRYMEMVSLVRLFLADERGLLRKALRKHIQDNADELDFEEAAYWRDILEDVEKYWNNPRWNVWLDGAVDTYEYESNDAGVTIFLVTQRTRNVVGRKVFTFTGGDVNSPDEAIAEIISTFYRYHVPREINVSVDFENRRKIAEELSLNFGREVKISVTRNKKRVASGRALSVAHDETELDKIKPQLLPGEMGRILRDHFHLHMPAERVEAFDVAHISGTSFVTASSVWESGRYLPSEYTFQVSDKQSEPAAMARAVMTRLANPSLPDPDLLVIDGGKGQLSAIMDAWEETDLIRVPIVGAVKPRGRHSAISHFLLTSGDQIPFDPSDPAHNMLQLLRDAAHDLSNRVHRDLRDMGHHYELAAILPGLNESKRRKLIARLGSVKNLLSVDETELERLAGKERAKEVIDSINDFISREPGPILPFVVPIRFDAEGGNAEDLRPIATK
jgi:excinuclease ABC subunit C